MITIMIFRDEYEIAMHSDDAFAPVGYVKFKTMHLEDKGIVCYAFYCFFIILCFNYNSGKNRCLAKAMVNATTFTRNNCDYTMIRNCRMIWI